LNTAGGVAAGAGLVTTSTTLPVDGTHVANVSGFTACVPGLVNCIWTGVVFVPFDICQ
jgi:hypothetical protein